MAREQVGLLGQLRVARQQHRARRRGGADDERAVVDGGAVVRVDGRGRVQRAQHVEGEAGPGQPPTGRQRDQRRPGRGGLARHGAQRPGGFVDRPHADPAHRTPAQRAREPADVVGVQVAEQHEHDAPHPEARQAGVDRPVRGPGVDQHHPAGARGGEHDGVALADVARHDDPARRRPAGRHDPGRHDHDRGARHRGEQQPPPPSGTTHGEDDGERADHEQGARRAVGPRERGAGDRRGVVGHRDEPAHGPSGEPDAGGGQRRHDRRDERGQHAEDRGRGDGGRRQQVGDDGDRADQPAQPGDERRRDDEGRRGHRERLGREAGHAAPGQRPRPRGREQHERRRGRHRQGEARVDGQRGLGEEQDEHRRGQRGQRRPPAACGQRHQRDRSHHRSAHDARRRSREHDEADQHHARHERGQPGVGAQTAQRRQHGAGQHGEVGAGDREEVGEPSSPEVAVHLGDERARVPDGQPRQQPRRGGRQRARSDVAQPGPEPARGHLPPWRRRDVAGRPAHPQHGDGEVGALRWREQSLARDHLPRQEAAPSVRGREEQHPATAAPVARARRGLDQLGGHHDQRRGRPA